MADTKISALTAVSAADLSGTVEFPANVGGASRKVTLAKVRSDAVVSVKDYGAVGDNSTDDTAAINNAITAVYNAGGGTVMVPAGTYIVGGSGVQLLNNVTLRGVGWASCIKLKAHNGTGIICPQASASNVGIADLRIDGNKANQTEDNGCFGFVSTTGGISDSFVERCWFQNVLRSAIYMEGPRNRAVNNWITGTGYSSEAGRTGIVLSGENVAGGYGLIANNYIEGSTEYGIKVYPHSPSTIIIGNRVRNSTRFGIYLSNSSYCTIEGNTVDGSGEDGILVQADNSHNGEHNVVVGNTITNGDMAGICTWNNGGTLTGVVISGNFVHANAGHGIISDTCPGLTITGNQLVANGTNNSLGNAGILLKNSPNVTITGNICRNNGNATAGYGIFAWDNSATNCTEVVVTGNRCYDDASGYQRYGIYAISDSDYWLVVGNNLRGNATAAYSIAGSNNTIASNL